MKNIASGIGIKILMLGLQFATRTLFINNLGSVYNGINSLVSSILSFLNMTELGIGTAIVYAMYKPVADNDEEKILQYLEYYKKVYHTLGLIVLSIGLALLPFFPMLAKGATDVATTTELYVIYGLYLLQSVSSFYVYTYRGGLISANQQDFRLTPINLTVSVLTILLQGASLIVLKGSISFYVYVGIPIVLSLSGRVLGGIWAGNWYPYVKKKAQGALSKKEKTELYKNVAGLAIFKICTILNSSADTIIISTFVGVALLGKYYNYQTIILMVTSFIEVLFNSLVPSVGNLDATADPSHKKKVFDTMHTFSFVIYGCATVCYFCMIQPFVFVWIGNENIIQSTALLIIICINFLTSGMCASVNVFRSGCGLYFEGRYRPIFTVLFNIGFSILLGYFWGIVGVILATIVSRFATIWWYDAYIVFKYVFNKPVYRYLTDYLLKLVFVIAVCLCANTICSFLPFTGWLKLFACAGISVAVCALTFGPYLFFTKEGKLLIERALLILPIKRRN